MFITREYRGCSCTENAFERQYTASWIYIAIAKSMAISSAYTAMRSVRPMRLIAEKKMDILAIAKYCWGERKEYIA